MARDEWGHLVLITALSVVDDTTLLRKSIVAELQVRLGMLGFRELPCWRPCEMKHAAATRARCSVLHPAPALHACMHHLCTMPPLYGCTMHTRVAWLPRKTVCRRAD